MLLKAAMVSRSVSSVVARGARWGGHVVRVAGTFGGIGVGRCGGPFVEVV